MFTPEVALDFLPGKVGGTTDWEYGVNQHPVGSPALGLIALSGTYFRHPDGVNRTLIQNDGTEGSATVLNPLGGDLLEGIGYLMWSEVVVATRFPGFTVSDGFQTAKNVVPVRYLNGVWEALDIFATAFSFTPIETDVLLARYESSGLGTGVAHFQRYTTDASGLVNTNAEPPPPTNYLVCERSGAKVPIKEGLVKEWTGLLVRRKSLDFRHPQELVRARRAEQGKGSPVAKKADVFVEDQYGASGVSVDDL
jgi:hypothetical protein